MPTVTPQPQHRVKIPLFDPPIHACIARPVNNAEIRKDPEAQAALDLEWDRLTLLETWDMKRVREWGGANGVGA